MKNKHNFLVLLFLVFTTNSCSDSTIEKYGYQQNLDLAIQQVRIELETNLNSDVPTISVMIQSPRGTYFTSSAGSNGHPLIADTYFRFASNTKNFTAVSVLKMQQDGWLNIDDKITNLISGTDIPYVPNTPEWDIPYKTEITIKSLLQHNAGVFDVSNDPVPGYGGNTYVGYVLENEPNHQFSATELVNQLRVHNLSYGAPNTVYHYSNTGFTILGEIISRIYSFHSGENKTYGDYLYDKIYGPQSKVPLGLHFAELATDQQLPSPYVKSMKVFPDETEIIDLVNASPHVAEGNGIGTFAQLNQYIRTVMKAENVLNQEMVNKMQNEQGPANNPDEYYGLGCRYYPGLGFGHTGATEGYLSIMMYDKTTDVSVIALLPYWNLTSDNSLNLCMMAIVNAAYKAKEALGYAVE